MSTAQYHTIAVKWTIHTSTYSVRRCFTLSEFLSSGTRYSCFMCTWLFLRNRANVDRETRWMLLKIRSLLMILAWISCSLIQLLAITMFTMAGSCARVNIGPLSHWCPRPSILCEKYTVYIKKYTCSLLSNVTVNNIDDKYSKLKFQCTVWLAYLFSRWNVRITDATVFLLRFGWTLCPASISVSPWLITWSISVARIS